MYAGTEHAASAEVEAAAAVPAVDAGAAPEAEVDTDVEATTEGVPGVEEEVAAAKARVWAEGETEAGPGSVPEGTGAGQWWVMVLWLRQRMVQRWRQLQLRQCYVRRSGLRQGIAAETRGLVGCAGQQH